MSRRESLEDAWAILACAQEEMARSPGSRTMSTLCFSALLMECEQRGLLREEVAVLHDLASAVAMADRDNISALGTLVANEAESRLLAANASSHGGRTSCPPASGSLQVADIPLGLPYAKEMRLLAHVLTTARAGDAVSVCTAIERFGEDVLNPEGKWLKIAGGTKADVLKVAVEQAPDGGSILEIGTYCGFSALRMALARPDTRIVTLEVDPAHMVIARNVL